jgi:hypothetical protein
MGLDIVIVVVLIALTLFGFRQGFIKGAASMLTPIIGLWLSIHHARSVANWFSPGSTMPAIPIAFAVLAIFVATYLFVRLIRYLAEKLFNSVRLWDMDRFLGGAFGLVRATAVLWIVLAFVFIAYPDGRRAIYRSPIATQILLFGEGMPLLKQKMDKAHGYVTALANPLKRYQAPELPDSETISNLKALQGMNLLGD